MNVTRSVLPVMRRQRSGHLIAISSGAGLMGFEYSSVYAASKAGLEGWMTALAAEVAYLSGTPAIDRPFLPARTDFHFLSVTTEHNTRCNLCQNKRACSLGRRRAAAR